jgi:sulfatase maturation enzyme AslB (radical SAM superfamily)
MTPGGSATSETVVGHVGRDMTAVGSDFIEPCPSCSHFKACHGGCLGQFSPTFIEMDSQDETDDLQDDMEDDTAEVQRRSLR